MSVSGVVALCTRARLLAFHLPYFPQSLEDLDSVNFALGVRDYDVGQHQPHPPGYPVYILIAKGLRVFTGSELSALSLLSMLAGAIGVVAMAALARRVIGAEPALWAALMAMTSPLYLVHGGAAAERHGEAWRRPWASRC